MIMPGWIVLSQKVIFSRTGYEPGFILSNTKSTEIITPKKIIHI